jgi:hypothetical protein
MSICVYANLPIFYFNSIFIIILKEKFVKIHRTTAHERAIEKCNHQNLFQAAYFIGRELQFLKEVLILFLKLK